MDKKFLEESLITNSELSQLQDLVENLLSLDKEIELAEEKLSQMKKEKNQLSQQDIPNFLTQFGISEIRLSDGKKVIIKDDVSVTIKNPVEFFKFLKDRHDEAIIKKILTVEDYTDSLAEQLINQGVIFATDQNIHPQTLKKYFRDFLQFGEEPPDSVKLFPYSYTKIK